tara:strand:+ start:44144 stop:45094 length:951 start_codon:yes stop_codon:yes gene_type:complete
MLGTSLLIISLGVLLIWYSAEKLEKYSVISAQQSGMSPFFIGSTVIAFGTSAPEMLTSIFAIFEKKGTMVIGNIIGSNIANLSLVFGSVLLVISLKKQQLTQDSNIIKDLYILLVSSILIIIILWIDPFSPFSSLVLLSGLGLVIGYWFRNGKDTPSEKIAEKSFFNYLKLFLAIFILIIAAWLITKGAMQILERYELGSLFIGFTILAIGTSLPEIAASISLAMKGRYQTVAGTLIGSNIFNGLFVLAIPGLFYETDISEGWNVTEWMPLLLLMFIITLIFSIYIFSLSKKIRTGSVILSLIFLSSYFISLLYAH